ncbi:MAG: O-antigen ligase family protein [Myxococcota bacterium]
MNDWLQKSPLILFIAGLQIFLLACFLFNPKIPVALVIIAIVVVGVMDHPILGVWLLLVSRLMSTGATVFLRLGRIGIGPFEPILLLCMSALGLHASKNNIRLWRYWPWQTPYLFFCAWVFVGLFWSADFGRGVSELLPLGIAMANTVVILTFVRSWKGFKATLWCWVLACVGIGVLALLSNALGLDIGVDFQAASGGGRETGLGQQPNWFAMNLMFIIHTTFGMAIVERKTVLRWILILSGLFIFVMMLKSGSRGGAYATLIGAFVTAFANAGFRRWFGRLLLTTVLIFGFGIAFNIADSASALIRIGSNISLNQNYRQLNWLTCFEMFQDSTGLGMGAGSYKALLPTYNNYLAQSLYDYPHGIFWELMAQYGVIGLMLLTWFLYSVWRMIKAASQRAKGTDAEIFVWTMPAAMIGYFAWSFVEFTITDKPFWEFLSLYTALYFIIINHKPGDPPLKWSEEESK